MPAMKPVRAGLAWYVVQSALVARRGVSVAGASVVGVMGAGRGGLSPQAGRRSRSGTAHAQAHARWMRARRPEGTRDVDVVRLSSLICQPFSPGGVAPFVYAPRPGARAHSPFGLSYDVRKRWAGTLDLVFTEPAGGPLNGIEL